MLIANVPDELSRGALAVGFFLTGPGDNPDMYLIVAN